MRYSARLAKFAAIAFIGATLAGCSSGPMGGLINDTITTTAHFENANGLYTGNAVSVLGMKVGKILSIDPQGDHVDIKMSIDRSVQVPANAQAVTVSDSILTDRHVELTPVYREGPTLQDNAVLERDHTKSPVEFDSVLAMADKLSKSLGGDGKGNGPIAGLVNVGADMTRGNGQGMKEALDQLSKALQLSGDNGAATKDAITKVVNNLNTLTKAAADNDQTIRQFGSGIHQMSDMLADQNLGTGNTGAQLNEILQKTTTLMQNNRVKLKGLASNSNVMTKTMSDYDRNLSEFLDVFPLIADSAYNSIDQQTGALRAYLTADKAVLDGQMLKDVCNLLGMKQLGCDTGTPSDMGPDFGMTDMLTGLAGLPK